MGLLVSVPRPPTTSEGIHFSFRRGWNGGASLVAGGRGTEATVLLFRYSFGVLEGTSAICFRSVFVKIFIDNNSWLNSWAIHDNSCSEQTREARNINV